jgi:hypothetical protein
VTTLATKTKSKTQPKAQDLLFAIVGAGDFAVEKAKSVKVIRDRKSVEKYYKDFVKRGQALSKSIKNSAPTKRAIEQTKTARSQVKAATTSITKALRADAKATGSAAGKVAKAS